MKESTLMWLGTIGIVLFAFLAVILQPLLLIWCLNQLFPILSIPYSFLNWLAVLIGYWFTFGRIAYSQHKIKEKL